MWCNAINGIKTHSVVIATRQNKGAAVRLVNETVTGGSEY